MNYIFKSLSGSFLRTLGRILAYLLIGILVGLLLSKGDFNIWENIKNLFSRFLFY